MGRNEFSKSKSCTNQQELVLIRSGGMVMIPAVPRVGGVDPCQGANAHLPRAQVPWKTHAERSRGVVVLRRNGFTHPAPAQAPIAGITILP